jgi:glycine/D-amino acid oxidase-like deaminating enzyme
VRRAVSGAYSTPTLPPRSPPPELFWVVAQRSGTPSRVYSSDASRKAATASRSRAVPLSQHQKRGAKVHLGRRPLERDAIAGPFFELHDRFLQPRRPTLPRPSAASARPRLFWVVAQPVSSEEPLPIDPARVAPSPGAFERLEVMCSSISPVLASANIIARQACYRPVTGDGLPLIGPVPDVTAAYIATGHSVWGILNAPATGEAMAELIVDGAAHTIDLEPFNPGQMPPVDPAAL